MWRRSDGVAMGRVDRWQNLVNGSFSLCERAVAGDASVSRDRALEFLNGVLEVFPPSIDPVDDFEGYAVRRMALALREALLAERVES